MIDIEPDARFRGAIGDEHLQGAAAFKQPLEEVPKVGGGISTTQQLVSVVQHKKQLPLHGSQALQHTVLEFIHCESSAAPITDLWHRHQLGWRVTLHEKT